MKRATGEILHKAEEEYKDVPPNEYYKEGYNLYRRMEKYMENHLLFLHDHRVPATNNEAERLLRAIKETTAGCVISESGKHRFPVQMYERACYDAPKKEEQNLFEKISQIFG